MRFKEKGKRDIIIKEYNKTINKTKISNRSIPFI